ncbi:hypothetical protein [Ekhidna sp.]
MKNLIALAFLILSFSSFAQNQDLRVERGRFYVNNQRTSLKNFVSAMESNPAAYQLALKAKSGYDGGSVLAFIAQVFRQGRCEGVTWA